MLLPQQASATARFAFLFLRFAFLILDFFPLFFAFLSFFLALCSAAWASRQAWEGPVSVGGVVGGVVGGGVSAGGGWAPEPRTLTPDSVRIPAASASSRS